MQAHHGAVAGAVVGLRATHGQLLTRRDAACTGTAQRVLAQRSVHCSVLAYAVPLCRCAAVVCCAAAYSAESP
eukprot:COSAG02_NODE_7669_length_2902_cov_1.222975_3_plen_73_part_00